MKIRSIIIDDIKSSVQTIVEFCKEIPEIDIIETANTVEEGILKVNELKPELLFLDIQLGNKSGFDLLDACAGNYQQVIFISAYENYALESYNYSTLHYLLKPISLEDLKLAVSKAQKRNHQLNDIIKQLDEMRAILTHNQTTTKLFLPTNNVWKSIDIANISYIEAKASYCMVIVGNSELMVSKPLKYFEDMLAQHTDFFRVHKSYIVNLQKVKEVYRGLKPKVILDSGTEIPLSLQMKDRIFTLLGIKNSDKLEDNL